MDDYHGFTSTTGDGGGGGGGGCSGCLVWVLLGIGLLYLIGKIFR